MAPSILGLDIGGANLKAATADKRAVSVPFPLWKQPDRLPAALAELVEQFPDAEELAVTMTGELCDCFETKRDGVNAIIKAVRFASAARPIHVWSTDGAFLNSEEAKQNHMKVASDNWHALATFAGRYVPEGKAILIDVGSTTTDIIPILDGKPVPRGLTDRERFRASELIYTGVRRTPICALLGSMVFAEVFATVQDAYLLLGRVAEAPEDCDTADGRPATRACAQARIARLVGADAETFTPEDAISLVEDVPGKQLEFIKYGIHSSRSHLGTLAQHRYSVPFHFIVAGSGEFLARAAIGECHYRPDSVISFTDQFGGQVSACAAAYAVAVLATERRPAR